MSEEHLYRVSSTWDPSRKEGRLTSGSGALATPFGGARSLGGRADTTNPEELLLSALAACFVQTWAIFLAKLKVPVETPALDGSLELGEDPAGGYRVTKLVLSPLVPRSLWQEREKDVVRTLELAEKYCIVSRALRGGERELLVRPKLVG
jgi:osmotically inducible protein OsmC